MAYHFWRERVGLEGGEVGKELGEMLRNMDMWAPRWLSDPNK
jgi:hypothetical protein